MKPTWAKKSLHDVVPHPAYREYDIPAMISPCAMRRVLADLGAGQVPPSNNRIGLLVRLKLHATQVNATIVTYCPELLGALVIFQGG